MKALHAIIVAEADSRFLLLASFNPIVVMALQPYVKKLVESECGGPVYVSVMRLRFAEWKSQLELHY